MGGRPAKAGFVLALGAMVALALAPLAGGERAQSGDIVASLKAGMSPHFLPRDRTQPVTVAISSDISSAHGRSLPPLRGISLALGGSGRIERRGLPTCREAQIRVTNEQEALHECGAALVGSGHLDGSIRLAGQESLPFRGRLLMFNGRLSTGRHVALAAVVSKAPPVSFVMRFLTRPATPNRPTELSARLPRVAGAFVGISHLDMSLGRTFGPAGRRRGYLEASCALPPGFTAFVVPVVEATYSFAGGHSVSVTASRGCSVKR
ncbi:MAG TPA: hypothetical protein VHZ54_10845 [Solirubrobacterales bacterium]|jgi:hypothetical protein|nr:hypothetical protein [Solirubrobacterales bacterium]